MKLDHSTKKFLENILQSIIYLTLVYYIFCLLPVISNPDNFLELLKDAGNGYFKIFALPISLCGITVAQFIIAYNNREIARKKNQIDLEDKALKEFTEIKEILEGMVETTSDSYQDLLNVMKIKDKSVEEKLLDKMEGKRFKFSLKYSNEELEYKKQISKMKSIINRGIENISFFLFEETLFDLSEEEIKSLKENMKKINDYFQNTYKKKKVSITVEQEIKEDILELLEELKEVTYSEKIDSIKNSLNKITSIKNKNKDLNWIDVQNAAREMIKVIEKI